jgi:hypothetical protein
VAYCYSATLSVNSSGAAAFGSSSLMAERLRERARVSEGVEDPL